MTEHTSTEHASHHNHEPMYQPPAIATPLHQINQPTTTYTYHGNNQPASGFAITSLVLGIVSLTGPGLLTGVPAIVLGAIALKKHQGGKGLSIAGVITGSIGTVGSLVYITVLLLVLLSGFLDGINNHTNRTYPTDSSSYQSS